MNSSKAFVGIPVFGALLALAGISPDQAFPQTPFYQGKTITIVAGTAPGGIGDNRVKAMNPFLRKYIPGNPAIVRPVHGRRRRPPGGQPYVRQCPSGRAHDRGV